MTETLHTRSRRASLGGLLLQLVAFATTLALALVSGSAATGQLAWYLLGGVPLWFVALLVFRQRELADLEALDLEELRREKQATGGGEALFGDEAGGVGFRVAEARLRWMQRWLIPGFGLANAIYLAAMGLWAWQRLAATQVLAGVELPGLRIGGPGWPTLTHVPIAMVALAVLMLGTFLYSRYTSGMGRVPEWQLLRGCGAYLLGNALAIMALLIALGIHQYAGTPTWEQALAYILPVVMVVLALETLVNFVLDIYRPRAPGVEARACFDSRLLGLLAEPGGIASSIADAINYQFGFQVSQTWFYQLLQRAFVPLVAVGAAALWLLTGVVVVQPYEHVIIERFGRQLNATDPLGPGLHFKWPWPIEAARAYNTGQLHELHVGFADARAVPKYDEALKQVMLWTDERHMGLEHFDFIIRPPARAPAGPAEAPATAPSLGGDTATVKDAPVNLFRADVAVQYRIGARRLEAYTRTMRDPHTAIGNIAWDEVGRYMALTTADDLLSRDLGEIGEILRQRIDRRVRDLGLDVVYVGLTNVHPQKTVAEAYRNVVKAEQEKVAAIREALVTENERLAKVAGDAPAARRLALAVERARKVTEQVNDDEQRLAAADPAAVQALTARLAEHAPRFRAHVDAVARLEQARDELQQVELDLELGLGYTLEQRAQAAEAVRRAEQDEQAAAADLAADLGPLRAEVVSRLGAALGETLLRVAEARVAQRYWEDRLAAGFSPARLEGEAAAMLAAALAERWTKEMDAARQLVQMQNEREAYRAAPAVYQARRLIEVLVEGLKDARKFFLAFEPGPRQVRVRFVVDDSLRVEPIDIAPPKQ